MFHSSSSRGSSTHRSTAFAKEDGRKRYCSRLTVSRIAFLVFLIGVAAVLGWLAHHLLTESETRLAKEQFEAIADRALDLSRDIFWRNQKGIQTMAAIAEQAFPDAEQWPNILINGFDVLERHVVETSNGRNLGLMPLVTPDKLQAYEDFCYETVFPHYNLPNTTGISSFGKGVYGLDFSLETPDKRFKVNGTSNWGSPYELSFPYLYISASQILMGDMHAMEAVGTSMDDVVTCSNERAALAAASNNNESTIQSIQCNLLTDVQSLNGGSGGPSSVGPGAVIFQPIYPANNKTVLVGLVSSTIIWDETLVNVFDSQVSGIDCVLKTETQVNTYTISNGLANLTGILEDLHDPHYEDYAQTIALNPRGLFGNQSALYTLTLYPNEEFFEVYSTSNPQRATIGAVCIVALISVLFILYDFVVRKDISHHNSVAKAKQRFVRFISHEVRTPLNIVSMGLQLLQDEIARVARVHSKASGNKASEDKHLLQTKMNDWSDLSKDILNNARSAVDVLDDLLNYDKIESKTLHLELTNIPIWELIERTAKEFKVQANLKNIELIMDYDVGVERKEEDGRLTYRQLPRDVKDRTVIGDAVRITQVLRNLISNALKFTPEEGILTIKASWVKTKVETKSQATLQNGQAINYSTSGLLKVDVTDTGAGMTDDQLVKVFSEGVQFNVNKLQAGKGSGLGLFIAKGILEQHGGTLTVASAGLGCGTTFTMSVPLCHVDQSDTAQHPQMSNSQLPTISTTESVGMEPLNILVVDDSALNRKLLVRLLQNQGHICTEAEDGTVAVQRVKDAMKNSRGASEQACDDVTGERYDSILMDNEMPKMTGPEAAKEIRRLGCDSYIVGVTGNMFSEQVANFKACGANRVLAKPLNLSVLVDAWVEDGVGGYGTTAFNVT